jgi:hypothetical protein
MLGTNKVNLRAIESNHHQSSNCLLLLEGFEFYFKHIVMVECNASLNKQWSQN